MFILFIGDEELNLDFQVWEKNDNYSIKYKTEGFKPYLEKDENNLLLTSVTPILSGSELRELKNGGGIPLKRLVSETENNFSGIEVFKKDNVNSLTISSCRISRDRCYFIQVKEGVYFSDDLRELIKFSDRKLREEAIYSVLKFGDTPEFITCVQDVYSVPVASLGEFNIEELLKGTKIGIDDFEMYQSLNYTHEGGDLVKTESKLNSIFKEIANKEILMPISGGIDSSLINYMVNDHLDSAYPAYYLRFGDEDPEVEFAKKAVKGTKAELEVFEMSSSDFIDSFHYQTDQAIQPIGESSTIALAYFFKQNSLTGKTILDGTLADGCYGSQNYSKGYNVQASKSKLELRINEKIAGFLQLKNLPGKNKFFPRDSYIQDEFLQQLNIYVGPLGNTLFKNTGKLNAELEQYFEYYYKMLSSSDTPDNWMKFSLFKMVHYASKNNTAKSFDNAGNENQVYYPFTWKSILEDQGKYTWEEKSVDGIIKSPLKKVMERYAPKNFIYRKKVGLNSSFEDWVCTKENKKFLIDLITTNDGIALRLMGRSKLSSLIKHFKTDEVHPNVSRLILNIAINQAWITKHQLV